MAVETLIPVEEYLKTSYDPDVEYVDGVLVERNVGEWHHSLILRNIGGAFYVRYPNVFAVPGLRSKTRPTRYRLPDICVLLSPSKTSVLLEASFIAIEILSPEDRMTRVIERLKEFEALGTPNIWLIDPDLRELFVFRDGSLLEVKGDLFSTETPHFELTRGEIFKDMPDPLA